MEEKKAFVAVYGMTCQHCADSIIKGLGQVEGVIADSVQVDLNQKTVTFTYNTKTLKMEAIPRAIEELGYDCGSTQHIGSTSSAESNLAHAFIGISGMTCSHCVNSVTKALSALDGIEAASIIVDLDGMSAQFNHVPDKLTRDNIQDAIDSAGYDVTAIDLDTASKNNRHSEPKTIKLEMILTGMTCDHCKRSIEQGLKQIDGVLEKTISIDVPSGKVSLSAVQQDTIMDSVKSRIEDLGYEVSDLILYEPSSSSIRSAQINIVGMTCGHCTSTVHNALLTTPGVVQSTIKVDLDGERACFLYDSTTISQDMLCEIIEDLGYDVEKFTHLQAMEEPTSDASSLSNIKLRKAVFRISGMTCESCVSAVTQVIKALPGVQPESVHVGLHTEMGMAVFEEDQVTEVLIKEMLDDIGYTSSNIQIIHNLLQPKVMVDDEEEKSHASIINGDSSLKRLLTTTSETSLHGLSIYSDVQSSPQAISMQISGMTCASCVRTIENNIKTWNGVSPESVTVNLVTGNGGFTMEKGVLTIDEIEKKIKQLGYKASDFHISAAPLTATSPSNLNVKMIVVGMYCPKCEKKVNMALQQVPGIIANSISVAYDSGKVSFQLSKNATSQREIQRVIQNLGFVAESIDISKTPESSNASDNSQKQKDTLVHSRLLVTGMTCSSCVANIEKTLLRHDGISKAQVNLLTKSAFVTHDPTKIGSRELVNLIEQIGYKAEIAPEEEKKSQREAMKERMKKEERILRNRFLWSLLFAIPVLLISMIFMMALPETNVVRQNLSKFVAPNLTIANLVLFILSTPVQFILGSSFYVKAYRSLRYAHTANMETLVALGTSVAYVASVATVAAAMAKPHSMSEPMNYFETSVFLITFIHLGKWLEALAKGKTAETITKLMDLQPEKAILVIIGQKEEKADKDFDKQDVLSETEIDSKDIQVGDILRVRAGERIPCDGLIWRGSSTLDESMITGESVPVAKEENSDVITATINMTSEIYIRAIRVGSNTTLSRIIQLVQDAQASPKAPIEVMADKISSVFVPIVILLAIITFIIWEVLGVYNAYPANWIPMGDTKEIFSIMFAVSVLVIACPCGLGLASPTAVMVGTGVAAKHGVLVKGGGYALEMANRISAIAFDKTGTLTTGKPSVRDLWILDNTQQEIQAQTLLAWKIFGRVASASNHPLSNAINQASVANITEKDSLTGNAHSLEVDEKELEKKDPTSQSDPFNGVELLQSKETPGRGLTATIIVKQDNDLLRSHTGSSGNVYNVFLGNEEWMKENRAKHSSREQSTERKKELLQWQNEGMSIVMFAISPIQTSEQTSPDINSSSCENECGCVICNCASHGTCQTSKTIVLAQIAIADQPRPEAKDVVSRLQATGVEVWMITGDNATTGKAVARQIGINEDCVLAGVKPEQKADKIKNLQRKYQNTRKQNKGLFNRNKGSRGVVAMIGDGINDSPALAQADVGVSVGSATDIAIEAASIVLIRNNLMDLLTMHDLSRTVVRRIRINFLWAFIYNIVAIPIAAGVIFPASGQGLPPYMAGLAMVISSLSVVCSSLMLRLYKAPKTNIQGK
ncbi:hypothetical protein INT43_002652 [Umbelopsis isabellina]|uniref:P-type Cu(+) transporter n=1 Tax=Mortierella isabellina TaxID=91625 RepID=A0A8H7Q6W5_MORIS|nr:hypothetical protein INT43_002652 [Umbelopsis isabellina]